MTLQQAHAAAHLARRIVRERRAYQDGGVVAGGDDAYAPQPVVDASQDAGGPVVYAGAPDQVQQQTPVAQTPDRTEQEVKDQPYGAPSLRSRVLGAAGWLMEQPGAGPAYEAAELNNQSRRQAIYNYGDPIAAGHTMHQEAMETLKKQGQATPEHDGSYTQTPGAGGGAGPGGGGGLSPGAAGPSLSTQAARGQPGGYLAPTSPSQSMDQLDAMSARSLRAIYATGDPQYTMAANQQVQAYQKGLLTRQMMQYRLNMLQQGYDQYQRDAAQGPPSQRNQGVQQPPQGATPGRAPQPAPLPPTGLGGPGTFNERFGQMPPPGQGAPPSGSQVASGVPLIPTAPTGASPYQQQRQQGLKDLGEEFAKGTRPQPQQPVPPQPAQAPAPRRSAGFGAAGYGGARVSNDADWQWAMQRVSQAADLGIPGAKGQLERMQKQWEQFNTEVDQPGYGKVKQGILDEAKLRSENPNDVIDDIQAEVGGYPRQRQAAGQHERPFTAGGTQLEYEAPKQSDFVATSPTEKGESAQSAQSQATLSGIRNDAEMARQAQQRAMAIDDAMKRIKLAGGIMGPGMTSESRQSFINMLNDGARIIGAPEIEPGAAGEAQLVRDYEGITSRVAHGLARRMDPSGRMIGLSNLMLEPTMQDSPYAAGLKKAYSEGAIEYAHQREKAADKFLSFPKNHTQSLEGYQEFMDQYNPPEKAIRDALVKNGVPVPVKDLEEAQRLPSGAEFFFVGSDGTGYYGHRQSSQVATQSKLKPVPKIGPTENFILSLEAVLYGIGSHVIGSESGSNALEGAAKGFGFGEGVSHGVPEIMKMLPFGGGKSGGRMYARGGRIKTAEQERAERSALRLAYAATRRAR